MYERVQFSRMQSSSVRVAQFGSSSVRVETEQAPSHPFPRGSLSISSRTKLGFPGSRPGPVSLRNIGIFPVSVTPPEVRMLRPLFLVFASKENLCFYILS